MSHILLDVKFIAFTLLLQVPNKLMDSLCHESANMWLAACFCKEGIGKQKQTHIQKSEKGEREVGYKLGVWD